MDSSKLIGTSLPLLEPVLAVFFVLAAASLGFRVLKLARLLPDRSLERFVWSASVGLALLSYLTLGLGMTGLLYREVFVGISILMIGGALLHLKLLVAGVRSLVRWFGDAGGFTRVLAGLITIYFLLNLVHPLAPPVHTGTQYYHLTAPKIFLREHSIVFLDVIYANGPFAMQLLNLFALGIWNDVLAAVLQYGVVVLGALAIFSIARRFADDRAGALAVAIFLAFRPLKSLYGTAGDIFGLTLFATLAVGAYVIWAVQGREKKWLALAAIATGIVCGVKYLGLGIGLLLTLAVIIECIRGASWRSLLWFCLIAGAIALPWYLKAWVVAGNPFWPFAYAIFGGKHWDAEAGKRLTEYLLGYGGVQHDWRNALSLPALAFLGGASMIMWFFPVWISAGKVCRATRRFVLFFCAAAVLWWFGSQQPRFLLPAHTAVFIACAIFMVRILDRLPSRWRLGSCTALLLIIPVDLSLRLYGPVSEKSSYLLNGADREKYLTDNFLPYRTIQWANVHLPSDAVVYVHLFTMQYFFDRPFLAGDYLAQGRFKWYAYRSAGEAHQALRDAGATHFFISANIAKRFNLNSRVTHEFRERYCDLLYHRNGSYLYRIREEPRPLLRRNVLSGATVRASSVWDHQKVAASAVLDGVAVRSPSYSGRWGWVSDRKPSFQRPESLELELRRPTRISEIRVHGYGWHLRTLTDFEVAVWDGRWRRVARVRGNREETEWFFSMVPVVTDRIRLIIQGSAYERAFVAEVQAYP